MTSAVEPVVPWSRARTEDNQSDRWAGMTDRAISPGREIPRSVTIAVTSSAGVTSKAGFQTLIPLGADGWPRQPVSSPAARSSIGIELPFAVERSTVELGAAT